MLRTVTHLMTYSFIRLRYFKIWTWHSRLDSPIILWPFLYTFRPWIWKGVNWNLAIVGLIIRGPKFTYTYIHTNIYVTHNFTLLTRHNSCLWVAALTFFFLFLIKWIVSHLWFFTVQIAAKYYIHKTDLPSTYDAFQKIE